MGRDTLIQDIFIYTSPNANQIREYVDELLKTGMLVRFHTLILPAHVDCKMWYYRGVPVRYWKDPVTGFKRNDIALEISGENSS